MFTFDHYFQEKSVFLKFLLSARLNLRCLAGEKQEEVGSRDRRKEVGSEKQVAENKQFLVLSFTHEQLSLVRSYNGCVIIYFSHEVSLVTSSDFLGTLHFQVSALWRDLSRQCNVL